MSKYHYYVDEKGIHVAEERFGNPNYYVDLVVIPPGEDTALVVESAYHAYRCHHRHQYLPDM